MANRNSKRKQKIDRANKRKGIISDFHGPDAFKNKKASPRSWKATKRHPANVAIGTRGINDWINLGTPQPVKIDNFMAKCHEKAVKIVTEAAKAGAYKNDNL